MLRAAAGLFADKAVRSQLEVQDSVPSMTSQDADLILPKLAYVFRSGNTSATNPRCQALNSRLDGHPSVRSISLAEPQFHS